MESRQGVSPSAAAEGGSRLISRVLPPAVRFWIHTQLDRVEALQFQLNGRDRQILKGYVPTVTLSAAQAVYQGLYLSQVEAEALEIRINLGQVVRGKPLRLLQPFPVRGKVLMEEADFNASLQSPLLLQALKDFLAQLWTHPQEPLKQQFDTPDISVESAQVRLCSDQLHLSLIAASIPLRLTAGLTVRDGQILVLRQPSLVIYSAPDEEPNPIALQDFEFDLGGEVAIDTLSLTTGQLELCGTVRVVPAD